MQPTLPEPAEQAMACGSRGLGNSYCESDESVTTDRHKGGLRRPALDPGIAAASSSPPRVGRVRPSPPAEGGDGRGRRIGRGASLLEVNPSRNEAPSSILAAAITSTTLGPG